MSRQLPQFTPEEQRLLRAFANEKGSDSRLWFYGSVLFAPVVFAVYGVLRQDYGAVLVAFIGLVAFTAWLVVGDARHAQALQGVCRKLVAFLDEKPTST